MTLAFARPASVFVLLAAWSSQVQAQASRYDYQLNNYVLPARTPVTFNVPVTAEGKISEFGSGYSGSGWRDLHMRVTLPDGTSIEQVAGAPWIDTSPVYGKQAKGNWTLRLIENQPGAPDIISTGFNVVAIRDANPNLPITGTAVRSLAGADTLITNWMRTNQIEASTFAIMKNGRLVYSRGYGWQDRARTKPTSPLAVSRWASNTKMLTATAISKLIGMGRLSRDSRAWDVLGIPEPAGMTITDPRHFEYTVDELLNHSAGLTRDVAYQSGPLGALLGLGRAATLKEMVSYMWTVPLEFEPNSTSQYSNWGYQMLGAIIEKVSGMSYDAFVRGYITAPLGATTFQVGRRGPGAALPNELWYAGVTFAQPQWDFNDSMALVEDPLSDDLETRPAAGSLVSTAPDYLRFLKGYFHTGEPKPASLVGWSWDYTFYGGGPGNCSATRERIQDDGFSLDWALLVNESDQIVSIDALRAQLDDFLATVIAWPTTDAFHTLAFQEAGGQVVMEAENFANATAASDVGPWQVQTAQAGYTGLGYLTMPSGTSSTVTWVNAAAANYKINIATTGYYNVWVLRYINGNADNSAYIGVDGAQVGPIFDDCNLDAKKWAWYKFNTKVKFSTTGLHNFTLKRRERDYKIDRIVLTKATSTLVGAGPAESQRL